MINKDYALKIFDYVDGELHWKITKSNRAIKGKKINSLNKKYKTVFLDGKRYLVHRIIFLMHYGYLPKYLDHIDGNPLNNKIENLREADINQNGYNSKIQKNNKSGVKGVYFNKLSKKWMVRLNVDGVTKYFGTYNDIDYAKFVSEAMRYKYHKEFARNV